MTSRTGSARRIWGDFEKVSWDETCLGGRRLVSLARGDLCGGCHMCKEGTDEKARIERLCLSLSLCRKTFKLKGNKKFRTWTKKSLRVFRISRFLCSIFMDIRCTSHTWPYHGYGTVDMAWNTTLKETIIRYIYYYYLLIKVFHISFSWWSFTGVWMTASLLQSPGPFSIML